MVTYIISVETLGAFHVWNSIQISLMTYSLLWEQGIKTNDNAQYDSRPHNDVDRASWGLNSMSNCIRLKAHTPSKLCMADAVERLSTNDRWFSITKGIWWGNRYHPKIFSWIHDRETRMVTYIDELFSKMPFPWDRVVSADFMLCWFIVWNRFHGALTRYVKFGVAHASGMPGTFSPPSTSKKTAT